MDNANNRPRLLQPTPSDGRWDAALRHFHITCECLPDLPTVSVEIRGPAAVAARLANMSERPFPLLIPPSAPAARPVAVQAVFERALAACEEAGQPCVAVSRQVSWLTHLAAKMMTESSHPAEAHDVWDVVLTELALLVDASDEAREELAREIERFRAQLPHHGQVIGWGQDTVWDCAAVVFAKDDQSNGQQVFSNVERLALGLRGLLQLDHLSDPASQTDEAMTLSLGKGADFLDPSVFLRNQPQKRGSKALGAERRDRISAHLETLERFIATTPRPRACCVVGRHPTSDRLTSMACRRVSNEPFVDAAREFDEQARRVTEVLRAVRAAQLELDNAYEPDLHDVVLSRLTWESCEADERWLLPDVLVVEDTEHLEREGTNGLSQLLFSGRPVRVLVIDRERAPRGAVAGQDITPLANDLAMIAVAHRETIVVQSSVARPIHLMEGLYALRDARQPAVAVVSVPDPSQPGDAWLRLDSLAAAHTPSCFRFDPSRGDSWSARFELAEPAGDQAVWPTATMQVSAAGGDRDLDCPLTFADAATLVDPLHRHILPLADEVTSDDLEPLSEFLESDRTVPKLPFIWVLDEHDVLRRALVSQALVSATWERARARRMQQELAGVNNAYVASAQSETRVVVEAEAEQVRKDLEAAHAQELDMARAEAAGETVDRIVRVLMSNDAPDVLAPSGSAIVPAASVAPVPEPVEPDPIAAPVAADDDDELPAEEPYIDSYLCTTCNDCTNINNLLFKYNDDKQAYIADVTQGTFKELVLAAEKCPARCIHPGAPQAGDETASEAMVARAAPFN